MKFTSFPFVSTIRLGIKSLMLHKLRSVLTMLGIIFGVCSVIAMLAIGEGASYQAQEEIKKLGSQNIIIRSLKPVDDANRANASRSSSLEYGLTYDDGARIQEIFEPFFTTKRDKKGTGLGLSMCRTIIDNHKGKMLIDSQPGKGTVIKILLPLAYKNGG